MGRLSEPEIAVAKKLGVFNWDSWAKARRQQRPQAEMQRAHPELLDLASESK